MTVVNPAPVAKRTALLEVLRGAAAPVSSSRLRAGLARRGLVTSDRSVRLYLSELCAAGLTAPQGRRGYVLTEAGRAELDAATAVERVGLLSARMDALTYRMDFDLATRRGKVVVNTAVVGLDVLRAGAEQMVELFARGLGMGEMLCLLGPGEAAGDLVVPPGAAGICTVCSITLNGVLLKRGIPTRSRFGGLLEVAGGRPVGFAELIHYDGTTVDPLEAFLLSGLTDHLGVLRTGRGRIGAGFREVPTRSREAAALAARELASVGLGSVLEFGAAGQPLLEVPVSEGYAGLVVAGGLNPVAVLREAADARIACRALAGLLDYQRLFHYSELADRLREFDGPSSSGTFAKDPTVARRIPCSTNSS